MLAQDRNGALSDVQAAGLATLIVLGSAAVWLGVPVAVAWLVAQLGTDGLTGMLLALLVIPWAMVGFGWLLYRVNERYERLRGGGRRPPGPPAWRGSLGEERASFRRARGGPRLIDVAMTTSAVVALISLSVWFFGFAEHPLSPLP